MTDTEWICGSCTANGKAEQPDECPDCGETHLWNFPADAIIPVALRYSRFLDRMKSAFRRTLH
ncbi:MAG: hypothetical protein ACT6QU_14635 [Aliihoeflea sp.]|uniref:hypothetical protein n=1 Tax=Aliihoeflea sp. TaxID=2608088 RepID=UPI0040339CA3